MSKYNQQKPMYVEKHSVNSDKTNTDCNDVSYQNTRPECVLRPIKVTGSDDVVYGPEDNTIFKVSNDITEDEKDYIDKTIVEPIMSLWPCTSINYDQLNFERNLPGKLNSDISVQRYVNAQIAYTVGRIAEATTNMILEYITQCNADNTVSLIEYLKRISGEHYE